ncbi:MAG: lyase family protein [Spirochaetota bacterium]
MERDIFLNLSPIDARYYKSNPELLDRLSAYLSESSAIKYEAMVEAALIAVMERYGIVPKGSEIEMKKALVSIEPEEVYREEEITKHNIRALVNVLQCHVSSRLAPFIHLTATSEDITSTANSLRIRDAFFRVVLPESIALMEVILDICDREAGTVQIGRTHGQHAVPITVGYLFAGYADRLGGRIVKMLESVKDLRGKISGAVGAYNASVLIFEDPRRFEADVLALLGLKPADFSSQILEPEYMLDVMHALVSAFGVLAQISDDMRHLQRTEIGEIGERFEKGQVGSSTMPHKRNPWNFEHVKSLWKEFVPRMITRYMDQISEHQRDLTNSASGRFTVEILTGYTLAVNRLTAQLKKLVIDHESIRKNLSLTDGMFLAEPLYILLASRGVKDAHEVVKQLTLRAEKERKSFFEIIHDDPSFSSIAENEVWQALERNPAHYSGIAEARAGEISRLWRERLKEIKRECSNYREINHG